jgi:hypothetical protein
MKKWMMVLFALCFLLGLWANGKTPPIPTSKASAGNIPDGMYSIMGESSRRCVEIPNSACGSDIALQTFDCDPTDASNNQKFNIVADGSGNYTISPVHSDLCLEGVGDQDSGVTRVLQNTCSPDKASQKWAMSQYGENLEIRAVQNNQCMDVVSRNKRNYAPISVHPCANGTNQRWRLSKKTLNVDTGIICRASPIHPEHNCSGLNDQQKQIHLGQTLTKGRCEEACRASRMAGCVWEGAK